MTHFPISLLREAETPLYYYDLSLLRQTIEAIKSAASDPAYCIHYAIKANPNPGIVDVIAGQGFGADTVSIGEVRRAVAAGIEPSKILFAGVGKSDAEIREALSVGVGALNVESKEELEVIEAIAAEMGVKAPVALRVNPEIDAHTHHYITTGLAENKFGIALEVLPSLLNHCVESEHLDFRGFHFHIGSQVTDFTPFRILCERINALQEKFADIEIPTINVGGGLGIDYENPDANPIADFDAYFGVFREHLKLRPGQTLHFEIGRAMVAQCGSFICKVVYVKNGVGKKFVILDGGMTALIRPALYQAHHKIENITSDAETTELYDVVGPICESSDTFGVDERLPITHRGDLVALRSAGAYGEAMASTYNCRPLPGAIFSE